MSDSASPENSHPMDDPADEPHPKRFRAGERALSLKEFHVANFVQM